MDSGTEIADEKLFELIGRGDESAFVALYRRRQGGIYRFAWQMSGSDAVAEDVTQEVFLTLIRDGCRFDAAKGTLSAYLYGVARKQVLRHLERDRGDVSFDAGEDAPEPADGGADVLTDLTRRESLDALRQAVLSLPQRYREAVVLCDLEEMDYAAAAVVLGCALGTVRSRLHRARALLVEKLNRGGSAGAARDGLNPARCAI